MRKPLFFTFFLIIKEWTGKQADKGTEELWWTKEFFSTLMQMPCNTFSETVVNCLKYRGRLKLKWILSCCGRQKAEADYITAKKSFIKGTEDGNWFIPGWDAHQDSWEGMGVEEEEKSVKAPKHRAQQLLSPISCLSEHTGSLHCAPDLAKFKV